MKKLVAIILASLMCLLPLISLADGELTMGSWRTEDAEQVGALLAKYEELTGVKIVFQPTTSTQYNATLRQQPLPDNTPEHPEYCITSSNNDFMRAPEISVPA